MPNLVVCLLLLLYSQTQLCIIIIKKKKNIFFDRDPKLKLIKIFLNLGSNFYLSSSRAKPRLSWSIETIYADEKQYRSKFSSLNVGYFTFNFDQSSPQNLFPAIIISDNQSFSPNPKNWFRQKHKTMFKQFSIISDRILTSTKIKFKGYERNVNFIPLRCGRNFL